MVQQTGQTQPPAPGAAPEPTKSRIEILEEVVYTLVDKLEEIANRLGQLEKTAIKKSTQRFGADHKPKAVKDTKTGKVYPSLFAAGKGLAAEYGLDPLDTKVYYQIIKKEPERLKVLEATDPEGIAVQAAAKAELEEKVQEANKAAAAEEAKAQAPKPPEPPKAQAKPKGK